MVDPKTKFPYADEWDDVLNDINPEDDVVLTEDEFESIEEMQSEELGHTGVEGIYNWDEWN
jgi:hypothetical protein